MTAIDTSMMGMQNAALGNTAPKQMKRISISLNDLVYDRRRDRVVRVVMIAGRYEGEFDYALVGWKGAFGRTKSAWVNAYNLLPIVSK